MLQDEFIENAVVQRCFNAYCRVVLIIEGADCMRAETLTATEKSQRLLRSSENAQQCKTM